MAFLRLVFTVYWDGVSPSTEPMFIQSSSPSALTLDEITSAESQVLAMLKAHSEVTADPLRAIFVSLSEVDLSTDEVEALGWRLMASATA